MLWKMNLLVFVSIVSTFIIVPASAQQMQDVVDKFGRCAADVGIRLDQCIVDLWMDARPSLTSGMADSRLAPIDPLHIPRMELPARGLIRGKAVFSNMIVTGLRNYEVRTATVDVANRIIVLNMYVPVLNIEGEYTLDGDVLALPIKGDGTFGVKLTDVDNIVRMVVDRSDNAAAAAVNPEFLRLIKLDVAFETRNITYRLDNLLGGGEVGVVINKVVNANAHQLLDSMKPQLSEKLAESFVDIAAVVVHMIPADVLNN